MDKPRKPDVPVLSGVRSKEIPAEVENVKKKGKSTSEAVTMHALSSSNASVGGPPLIASPCHGAGSRRVCIAGLKTIPLRNRGGSSRVVLRRRSCRCLAERATQSRTPGKARLGPPRPKWVELATDRNHQKYALYDLSGAERRFSVPCTRTSDPDRTTARSVPGTAPRRWGGHVE